MTLTDIIQQQQPRFPTAQQLDSAAIALLNAYRDEVRDQLNHQLESCRGQVIANRLEVELTGDALRGWLAGEEQETVVCGTLEEDGYRCRWQAEYRGQKREGSKLVLKFEVEPEEW